MIDHFRNPYAGTECQLYRLLTNLNRDQFEPELPVFTESEFLREEGFPCPWSSLDSASLSSPATWVRLIRFVAGFRKRGGRLAHVFFNDPSIICPPVFSAFGIRTLISRRDMGYWYTPGLERLLRITRFFVTDAVVNSRAVADITHSRECIPMDRIHLIYNGVVEDVQEGRNHHEVPPELGAAKENGAVVAILVANIRPIKRIQDVVAALGEIAEDVPDLHLVVVGAGDSGALVSQSQELGVSERIHFLGARDNVPAYLKAADIGVLCSESEGFSNSIVEYMQHGLAVICTETGGNPEAIYHNESGLLYPVGDDSRLASNLAHLAMNPVKRQQMGECAKTTAGERFSIKRMVEAHEALYDRLSRYPHDGR